MKKLRKITAVSLAAMLLLQSSGTGVLYTHAAEEGLKVTEKSAADGEWKYGLGDAVGFNESTYESVEKKATKESWREGSVSANGEMAFIESCDPKEDVFIFNNTKIVSDGTDIYETPVISDILDKQRKGAIERKRFPWINAVNKYASSTYGTSWGLTWPRSYQPAAQYRIINNSYSSENANNYNRYTNYETGEVGVQWKDDKGNEWNRKSFASRSDDIIVTYIEAPDEKDLDITLSMDHIVEMHNSGTTNPCPESDYVVTKDANGYAFGMVGKYPIQNRKGSKNKQPTKFAYGGWGTATRILTDGNLTLSWAFFSSFFPYTSGGLSLSSFSR